MSSYEIHGSNGQLTALEARVRKALDSRTRLRTIRDQVSKDLAQKEAEVETLTKKLEILTHISELFRHLMDQLIEKQVKIVERITTEGLQTVFHDLDLSLEADVEPKYNKVSVEFFLRKGPKGHPGSHRNKPLAGFGGGPSSVVSLILRVLSVKKLKLWPVLILDESLGAVSDEYIDLTGQFIQALSKKLGFDVLLVTHKSGFLDHSDLAYRCTEETEEDGVTTHVSIKRTL